jgi:hypothetical protein
MSYYIRQPEGIPPQIWKIDEAVAVRLGVTNPENEPGSYFKADPGETIWDTMRRQASAWFEPLGTQPFHKTILAPGQYYPRIARPSGLHPTDFPRTPLSPQTDMNFVAIAHSQLTTLLRQLHLICETVHPCPDTFSAYGHNIRNLLILTCTETRGSLARRLSCQ